MSELHNHQHYNLKLKTSLIMLELNVLACHGQDRTGGWLVDEQSEGGEIVTGLTPETVALSSRVNGCC